MRKKITIPFICAFTFFVFSLITLQNYGVSWDEATHFKRGQAYLHIFITGKTNYSDIKGTRSFYQNDIQDGKFWLKDSEGHPPLNDISASFLNYVFYQKLGILNDLDSYHLFNILASSLLVFVVVAFSLEAFGLFPAIISFLVLSTYPLFWSESHFNIKDPVEAAFFAATIWSFWKSLKKGSIKWLIPTFIFFTFAIGTKFNALFIFPSILPLVFIYRDKIKKFNNAYFAAIIIGLALSAAAFTLSWPALWNGFPGSLLNVLKFYKQVGSGTNYQPENFYIFGFNSYPSLWLIFTTPILTLALTILGFLYAIAEFKKKRYLPVVFIVWLVIPILRVSLPGTSLYGGIRQIMEFLPAMAILAGIGSSIVIKRYRLVFVLFTFIILLVPILKFHPNENVYFNFLIGGISGASRSNFPSWGNSFGNTYRQGINWINENAEKDSKLTLLQGELINAPKYWVRSDIDYKKENFSGDKKKGEYIMELTFDNTVRFPEEGWNYVENELVPVHEIKVDGISILKIWKNDLDHSKGY